jgi:hypothetical protein
MVWRSLITRKEGAKMIRWTRTGRVTTGKIPAAIQWAKEIAEYCNKYNVKLSVYMDRFSDVGTIRWFADLTDLAAWEKFESQLMADKEYWQKVNQAVDLFIEGSFHDTLMRAI